MTSSIYGKCCLRKPYYGNSINGKSIIANKTEPLHVGQSIQGAGNLVGWTKRKGGGWRV